jgi:hypothetical protein
LTDAPFVIESSYLRGHRARCRLLQRPTNTSGDLTVSNGRTEIPADFGTLCRESLRLGHFLATFREFPQALEAMKKATGD